MWAQLLLFRSLSWLTVTLTAMGEKTLAKKVGLVALALPQRAMSVAVRGVAD